MTALAALLTTLGTGDGTRPSIFIPMDAICGYFDSAYMGGKHDRHSAMGYAFFCAGSLVSWSSKTTTDNSTQYYGGRGAGTGPEAERGTRETGRLQSIAIA